MTEEEKCGCGEEECTCDEEMSTEELAESNHMMLNALMDLLIEKKVISEEEFDKKIDEFEEGNEETEAEAEKIEEGEEKTE